MEKKRQRVGVIIDYSIRNPEFVESYINFKSLVLGDKDFGHELEGGQEMENWVNLKTSNPKAFDFYSLMPNPKEDENFDLTWKKYFYSPEHRVKFIYDWSYDLFGKGSAINNKDLVNLNTAQKHLFDIVLIDRVQNTRKISNTFSFLSKVQVYPKEIIFVSKQEEIEELTKDLFAIWDPFTNKEQIIKAEKGQESKKLLDWLLELEKKITL